MTFEARIGLAEENGFINLRSLKVEVFRCPGEPFPPSSHFMISSCSP